MKALAPLTPMPTLRQELDRVFARFWDDDVLAPTSLSEWVPALDVAETEGRYVLKVECPGMEVKDIRVKVENGILTLQGEKKTEFDDKTNYVYRTERTYGSFTRSVRFPTPVDGNKVVAKLHNGVLTIDVPKVSAGKESNIPIQVT
jgi:HSP20 family protein